MNPTLFPGKIYQPQLWKLEIKFWPMMTENSQLSDIGRLAKYPGFGTFENIQLNVAYDNDMLFQSSIANKGLTCHRLEDDKNSRHHDLEMWISGKHDDHSPIYDDVEVSVCVASEILIENIPVSPLITGGGPLILGEDNKKIQLSLETPIYRWLLRYVDDLYKIPSCTD